MSKIFEFLAVAISTAAGSYVQAHLFGAGLFGHALAVATGVCAYALLQLSRYCWRRFIIKDEKYLAIGTWYESMTHPPEDTQVGDPARYYSIFNIRHDFLTDEMTLDGHTFRMDDLSSYSDWKSIAVSFPSKDTMYYIFSGNMGKTETEVVGLARLNLFRHGGRYFEGRGSFVNNISKPIQVTFDAKHLTREDIKKAIGTPRLRTRDDRKKLLRAIDEENRKEVERPAQSIAV